MKGMRVIAIVLVLATVSAAHANFAIHKTDGVSGWYAQVSPTVSTTLDLSDKSLYEKQLFALLGEDNWSGISDLSATGYVGFNETRIFWHFTVVDDLVTNIAARASMFLGDAVEIGLAQSDTDSKRAAILMRPTASDATYVYRPDDGSVVSLQSLVVTTTKVSNGWIADGSCLLSDLGLAPEDETPFRLNILIYDQDNTKTAGYDTIYGMASGADNGYSDMSVWSNSSWLAAPEPPLPQSLTAEIKKLVNGTKLQLVGSYVTLVATRDRCFFLQTKTLTGLKVNFPQSWAGTPPIQAGQVLDNVTGTIRIRNNQRELDAESVSNENADQYPVPFIGPDPLCIRAKDLGGSDPYSMVPRVGGFGPSNIGLLTKTYGKVSQVLPTGDFVLSDGQNDTLVYYAGALPPSVGDFVSITGAVTTNLNDPNKAAVQAGSNACQKMAN